MQPLSDDRAHVSTRKHAYLITAYDNFPVLRALLQVLDDERNDIFVHIDKKTKNVDFENLRWPGQVSTVTFVPRIKVYWADYSQVRSVLALVRAAIPGRYAYYHLLSGSDLPLRPQDQIHEFFSRNSGQEFVGFASGYDPDWVGRIHILNRALRPVGIAQRAEKKVAKGFLRLQEFARYDRRRTGAMEVRKGSDWFSITHELAVFLSDSEPTIQKMFKWAKVPTEFYLQTIVWNSSFIDRVFEPQVESRATCRYVDWVRGSPYTLRLGDFEELVASDYLFARKFDWDVDPELVRRVVEFVTGGRETAPSAFPASEPESTNPERNP